MREVLIMNLGVRLVMIGRWRPETGTPTTRGSLPESRSEFHTRRAGGAGFARGRVDHRRLIPAVALTELAASGVARSVRLRYKVRAGHVIDSGAWAEAVPGQGWRRRRPVTRGPGNLAAGPQYQEGRGRRALEIAGELPRLGHARTVPRRGRWTERTAGAHGPADPRPGFEDNARIADDVVRAAPDRLGQETIAHEI